MLLPWLLFQQSLWRYTTHIAEWRHQVEIFFVLLALCEGSPPVNSGFPSQRPVTRSFAVYLIYAWTNGWANNRYAGELGRHGAHHDVTVMDYFDIIVWHLDQTSGSSLVQVAACFMFATKPLLEPMLTCNLCFPRVVLWLISIFGRLPP